jgi:hypothetical protein
MCMSLCGVVALWRCGVVALWRCGVVALWRCGVVWCCVVLCGVVSYAHGALVLGGCLFAVYSVALDGVCVRVCVVYSAESFSSWRRSMRCASVLRYGWRVRGGCCVIINDVDRCVLFVAGMPLHGNESLVAC